MPRIARRDLKTCFFHVIVQGINREYIFDKDRYKRKYRFLLKKKREDIDVTILSYCIMDNHVHLLMYTNDVAQLQTLMRRVNTSYAIYYNKNQRRVGYVYRDRYYVQPIKTRRQLYRCINYIHSNPVTAGICKEKSEYLYSSYGEFFTQKGLITKKSIIILFVSMENYLLEFERIHSEKGISDIKDVTEKRKHGKR